MNRRRQLVDQFQLPNVGYVGCAVAFYVADANGHPSTVLATLYDNMTGPGTVRNPQTFGSNGALPQPTYFDTAVVPIVTGAHAPSQMLGVICPPGGPRGAYAGGGTLYLPNDIMCDGAAGDNTGDLYSAVNYFASIDWATDVADPSKLKLLLDVAALSIAPDATTSAKGKIQIASQAVTDAGSSPSEAVTPKSLHDSVYNTDGTIIPVTGEATAVAAGAVKTTFRMPFKMQGAGVRASLRTAQSSGAILTIDVNKNGSSILGAHKLTVDNGEKSSATAGSAADLADADWTDDAEFTVDVDQIGDGTAAGLKVYMIGKIVQ